MRRLKGDQVELNPTETQAYAYFEQRLAEGESVAMATEQTRKTFSVSRTFLEWLLNP